MRFRHTQFLALALMALLCVAMLGGCKTSGGLGGSKSGIAVEVLMPPDMAEWEGCGDPSLILVSVDRSAKVASKQTNNVLLQQARKRLSDVSFFTMREMEDAKAAKGMSEVVAAHHFLTFRLDTLNIENNSDETLLSKTVDVFLSATLRKSNGDDSYTSCGTKTFNDSFTSQAPIYDKADFPSNTALTLEAIDEVVDMVVRQISPRKIVVYRSLRSGMGETGRAAGLIDGGSCDIALDILRDSLKLDPKDVDALYNAGVANECLARKSTSQSQRVSHLAFANAMYTQAVKTGDTDQDLLAARNQVKQSLVYYAKGTANAEKAMAKIKGNGELEFMGFIE